MDNSPISQTNSIPIPPFWGSKCIDHIPLRAILPYINRTALYKLQWGVKFKDKTPAEYKIWAKSELDPILHRLIAQNEQEQILQPKAVYGYFPCQTVGNELIIYHSLENLQPRCQFHFPRQTSQRQLCITDFFRSQKSSEIDVVAFQLVTVGQKASDFARELFNNNHYQEYLYWHGLNAEAAEGLAEYLHQRIRAEWGFAHEDARDIAEMMKQKYRGSRYSFGYPACPNLADQDKILSLLNAERIGVTLGEESQLWPEESTSAIVVHHPQAKYFNVGATID